MELLSQAAFWLAAARPADLPAPGPPEIVFAGRSNVGKSSAINALVGRRKLARVSKTPGRTQTINFYSLGEAGRLVDLPGYGYARVARSLRQEWGALVRAYRESRTHFAGLVVVMDARRPLTALDTQLLDWLAGQRTLLLLSKADKLARTEQRAALQRVASACPSFAVRLFSSLTRQGVAECRDLLEAWLQADRQNKRPPVKGM